MEHTKTILKRIQSQEQLSTFKGFIDKSTSPKERIKIIYVSTKILCPDDVDQLIAYSHLHIDPIHIRNYLIAESKKPFMFKPKNTDWDKYNKKNKSLFFQEPII